MENKITTKKTKRWIIPAAINICLIIMCGMIIGTYAFAARAETAETVVQSQREEWYKLSEDGTQLSVFLDNSVGGYVWRYGSSNEKLIQIHSFEIEEEDPDTSRTDAWKLYLKPRDDDEGDVQLTFVCVKDVESDSIDTRVLKVHIKNGKMVIEEGM